MIRSALVLLLIGIATTASAESIYRWTDAGGVTHFSQEPPPPGVRATVVHPNPLPALPAPGIDGLKRSNKAYDDSQSRSARAQKAALKLKAETLERCAKARERIAFLEQHPAHRLSTRDAQGTVSRMTDGQYDTEMKKARANEEQNCS